MQHMILMSEKMTSQNKLYEIKSVPYQTLFHFLCLCMGPSTFQEFLGGKGMFLCFYVSRKQACGHSLTIHNSTAETELTIDVRILAAKIRKSNIIELPTLVMPHLA
jgi:hypothetical protein